MVRQCGFCCGYLWIFCLFIDVASIMGFNARSGGVAYVMDFTVVHGGEAWLRFHGTS